MGETDRRHCEALIRFVAGRSNLAGLVAGSPRGRTPRWARGTGTGFVALGVDSHDVVHGLGES